MSDLPVGLVKQLSGSAENTVYLPANVRPGGAEKSETVAARPEVQAIAREYYEDPDRFHGDRVAETTIFKEKPIHRSMILLHAKGMSLREISNNTGYSYQSVCQLMRQPWARLRLAQFLKEAGIDEVKHFLKHEVSPSFEVLRTIRDSGSKDSDRINATKEILDRALGKPVAHVESSNTNRNVPVEAARLEAELAEVRRQLDGKGIEEVPVRN